VGVGGCGGVEEKAWTVGGDGVDVMCILGFGGVGGCGRVRPERHKSEG
jgi:hypothetical protein